MSENPYESPLETAHAMPKRVTWLLPSVVLLVASYLLGGILTPADPYSSLLAAIPIFVTLLLARWSGVRAGRREVQ